MKKAIAFFTLAIAGSFSAGFYAGRKLSTPVVSDNNLFVLDEVIRRINRDQDTQTERTEAAKAADAAPTAVEIRITTPRAPLMRKAGSSVNSEDGWSKPTTPSAPPSTPVEPAKTCCMM